jgi:hypothetical protein
MARRYQETISRVLYIRDSVLRRRDITGDFTMQIGLGLFARTIFRPGEKIVYFVGEIFYDIDEFDQGRVGHKPYILHSKKADDFGNGEWLDCFNSRAENRCLASVSNSPFACFNIKTQKMALANCRLKVSHHADGPRFSLEATTTINAHDEILWSYGADYEYPNTYPVFMNA